MSNKRHHKGARKEEVRKMFNSIAPRYDFLNHFLSFGIDFYWRRRVFRILKKLQADSILDIATGTGDLAILAARTAARRIVGVDLSPSMVAVGIEKIKKRGLSSRIDMQVGDAEELAFEDHSFDTAMVAFGVRNFENLEKGLREIRRVLKPGGTLIILEFSHPRHFPFKQLYHFYSFNILPLIGRLVSNDPQAYTYLPESVAKFPAYGQLTAIMEDCGYTDTHYSPLTMGIATLYTGKNNEEKH